MERNINAFDRILSRTLEPVDVEYCYYAACTVGWSYAITRVLRHHAFNMRQYPYIWYDLVWGFSSAATDHRDTDLTGLWEIVESLMHENVLLQYAERILSLLFHRNIITPHHLELWKRLVGYVAGLRRELWRNAHNLLGPEHPTMRRAAVSIAGKGDDALLDSEAWNVWKACASVGSDRDLAHLRPRDSHAPIYCDALCTYHISVTFEILWQSGFRDIDARHSDGSTPLIRYAEGGTIATPHSEREALSWLLKKGADPRIRRTSTSWSAVDFIVRNMFLPEKMLEACEDHELLSHGDEYHDECQCACSTRGCVPLTKAAGSKIHHHRRMDYDCRIPPKENLVLTSLKRIFRKYQSNIVVLRKLYRQALRILFFFELDLTHTCCLHGYDGYGPNKDYELPSSVIREIRKSESERIQLLEEVMGEAIEKLQSYQGSFEDLWIQHCQTINARCAELEAKHPDHEARVRELGVRIERDEPSDNEEPRDAIVEDSDLDGSTDESEYEDCE
jgi:hypothetical protein